MELQKKDTSLPMVKVTKPSDLLKAKPMAVMVREHGEEPVKKILFSALSKCAFQIGVELQDRHLATMAEDLIEKYTHDSVEDIVECLKKGRQGNYGTTYNKLNMIVISEWMGYHLEEKAEARERQFENDRFSNEGDGFHAEYSKRIGAILAKKKSDEVIGVLKEADELINKNVDFDRIRTINQIRKSFNDYINDGEIKTDAATLILHEFREVGVIQGKITNEHEAIKRVFDSLIAEGMDINDLDIK